MCSYPEKWGSCVQQAFSLRPAVPHVLHVPEHVSSACPRSLGEYWAEVFCSWQTTGCKNPSICFLWVGNHWNDSARVVSVARVTFGRRLSYGAALPLLSPIFLYSRMASFREKVHYFNWIFSILRGVKINIPSGFIHAYTGVIRMWYLRGATWLWSETRTKSILCEFLFLPCRLWKRNYRILIPIEAQESQGCELLH